MIPPRGRVAVHQALADLHPDEAAVAAAELAFAAPAPVQVQVALLERPAAPEVAASTNSAASSSDDSSSTVQPVSSAMASLARWMRRSRTKAMPTSERLNISSRSRASDLELDLLRLQPRHVGQHGDRFGRLGLAAGAPHRQRSTSALLAACREGVGGSSNSASWTSPTASERRPPIAISPASAWRAEELLAAASRRRAGVEAEHGLEAAVAAHQRVAAQVGDARRRALEDRRHLAQQLLVALLAALLLGDVERHDRRRALARGQRAGSTRVSSQRGPSSGWRIA